MMYTIRNEYLTVTAAAKGAELQSILDADGTEYLWQGDPKYWADRALNIFPFVARLTEGSYYLDGKLQHMQIHGIAPYRDFALVSNDGNTMVLELSWDEDTYAQYPRRFVFRVIYALEGRTLGVTYEVENRDGNVMYFGLGGHPGFNVPISGGNFEDYRLTFPESSCPRRVCFTEDCFVTDQRTAFPLEEGRYLQLRHDLFDDDAIVLENIPDSVILEPVGEGKRLIVAFPQLPYLGIWHWPLTDAPYVCIEPWSSLPARAGQITVFEEQEDLLALDPGKTYRNRWTITVTE